MRYPERPAWTALDDKSVAVARALAMDAVQKVGNGHPGTAMSLAPVAYTLFQRFLRHDPSDSNWIARDRFVLSCGHSSLTLYIQLFFSGYGLKLDDLKSFRTWGSLTPGHPEYGHTLGVETTTGPLGQGVANAVGMAMAARYKRGLFDPESAIGESIFDHNIWVICSDGDLQEGVSAEASSLAGTQELGALKVIYDDNRISIDGDTHHTFTEDVSARYRSYGWNVIEVAAKKDGDVDRDALEVAMQSALEEKIRPTLIRLKTVIAWPAPKARNTAKSHGSALGKEEVAATKLLLGLPEEDFYFPTEVHQHVRKVSDRSQSLRTEWNQAFESWKRENPAKSELLQRLESGSLPSSWQQGTPSFPSEKEVATRKASGELINHFAKVLPELIGGSADLAESNNTTVEGGGSFLPSSSILPGASPYGRNIFFGIREHAMGAILNGMALHGGLRPYAGTFLVFSDYMRGAVRLSALMKLPVIYVWTHDSIGLGEDGPTHQPIEHFAALRAIPGLDVIRPADANEVAIAWQEILRRKAPAGLLLSRQNLPVIDRASFNSADGVARGAYALNDEKNPELIIIATGSEVSLALAALSELTAKGVKTRVVSAPCLEWFKAQPESYKDELLPKSVKARVSVEAGIAQGWRDLIGDAGESISIEHFGASASHTTLFSEFGFTVKRVIEAAEATLKRVR
ncbi:MAG: transketolase [Actinobacteria bacterium]|nr:transketolase [Actinomycetota bacterium]NCX00371.1 transketolase [Actinomycetota bacterium]NCX75675.1 transketolase [Actinomycetota bacterium]